MCTRKHSSRMHTDHRGGIRFGWVGEKLFDIPDGYTLSAFGGIPNLPESTWYQGYLPLGRDIGPRI